MQFGSAGFQKFYLATHIEKDMAESRTDFYLRYYVGHKGKFGHEFLEFEFRPDGL